MGKSCHWSLKQGRIEPKIPNLNLMYWYAFNSPLHCLFDPITMRNPALYERHGFAGKHHGNTKSWLAQNPGPFFLDRPSTFDVVKNWIQEVQAPPIAE